MVQLEVDIDHEEADPDEEERGEASLKCQGLEEGLVEPFVLLAEDILFREEF